jgi:cytochrome P450
MQAELANASTPAGTSTHRVPTQYENASCVLICPCRLTDVEITDNLLLVLLAGFDTSSTTLTAVLAKLQQHPAAAEQLCQEQQAVMEKHGPGLSAAVLRDMPYADAVIRSGPQIAAITSRFS